MTIERISSIYCKRESLSAFNRCLALGAERSGSFGVGTVALGLDRFV